VLDPELSRDVPSDGAGPRARQAGQGDQHRVS
jgi:hypothetical protein